MHFVFVDISLGVNIDGALWLRSKIYLFNSIPSSSLPVGRMNAGLAVPQHGAALETLHDLINLCEAVGH